VENDKTQSARRSRFHAEHGNEGNPMDSLETAIFLRDQVLGLPAAALFDET